MVLEYFSSAWQGRSTVASIRTNRNENNRFMRATLSVSKSLEAFLTYIYANVYYSKETASSQEKYAIVNKTQ